MRTALLPLLLILTAFIGCGEVPTPQSIARDVAKDVAKEVIKYEVKKAIKKKLKPAPKPVQIWSPVKPIAPQDCPNGKCPYGAVIYDGAKFAEVPTANLPKELRQKNWGPSCVFASTASSLNWVGESESSAWLRKNYRGGSNLDRIANALDKGGVKYAYTYKGDFSFLEWCNRTRRQAMIFYYSNHAVTFVGIHNGNVYLLDNNRTSHYQIIPIATFIPRWKSYGGVALAVLDGSPAPPLAWTN